MTKPAWELFQPASFLVEQAITLTEPIGSSKTYSCRTKFGDLPCACVMTQAQRAVSLRIALIPDKLATL